MSDTPDQILKDIEKWSNEDPGGKNRGTNKTIYHFARLLVDLDKKAGENAARNLALANSVRLLTWWLLGLTLVLTFIGIAQVYFAYVQQNSNKPAAHATGATNAQSQVNVQPTAGSQSGGKQNPEKNVAKE